ncbi:uncharacterized protein LOC122756500 [Drosophila santomea]|uniref:uncharacterized protein LOC122756500 n=1 Tax=Drosophila santomea TaxID=129105 RepID=UPI001CC8F21D|nr:uncharacterized protein LOC122756500 [Drosophila santomea]
MSADGALRQRDELRRSESPHPGSSRSDRGAGGRNSRVRIKKRMRICGHTPSGSAHGRTMGGVKTAKHLLLRAVGSALLNAEEVAPVLVGIEATMNSRPLGALSQDPSDGEALTPGHLLTGGPLIAAPALRTPDQAGLSCLRRWRFVSSVRQTFWRRWSREYVLGLQVRGKWHKEKANVEEGQLV